MGHRKQAAVVPQYIHTGAVHPMQPPIQKHSTPEGRSVTQVLYGNSASFGHAVHNPARPMAANGACRIQNALRTDIEMPSLVLVAPTGQAQSVVAEGCRRGPTAKHMGYP